MTTVNITGGSTALADALGVPLQNAQVRLKPFATADAVVVGSTAKLGQIVYAVPSVPSPLTVDAGHWEVWIEATATTHRYSFRQPAPVFETIHDTINLTADTSWASIVSGAVSDLPFTPSLLTQAQTAATNAASSASAAAASAASVQREQAGGTAGLDGSGKLYEARIPDRLSDTSLAAAYDLRHDASVPVFDTSRYVKEGDSAASVTSNLQAIAADAQAAHGVMVLPRGTLTYNGTIATLTDRCGIIGYGKRHTRLVPGSGFTGDAIAVNDCWRNNTEDSFTATTSGAVGTNKSGVVLRGFSIQGDRATQARGLIFYGRNDDVLLDDIGLYYLNGKALGIGGEDAYGLMRESLIRNVRVQGCGNATDAAVQLTVGATVGDITNHIAFDNCQFVYPFGVGLHILNPRTAAMRRITFDNLMLHGQYTGATVGADVMVVEGDVEDLSGYIKTNGSVNIGGTPYAAIRFKANATSGLRPSLVDLKVAMRSMNGDGIVIDGADAITLTGMSQPSTIAGSEVKFSANSTVRAQVDIIANSARSFSIDSTVTDKVFGRADTLDVDKVATLGLVNRSSDPAQLDNTVQWYAKSGAPYFRAPNPDGTVSNVLLSREVRRSTDSALAVSSTALVADSTLSLNIRSGAVYEVVAHVIADGPQTADLSIGFTASTAPTMDWTVDPGLATNITSASGSVLAPAKAWGDTITVGLAGVGTKTVTRIVGRVVGGGAAGTIVPLSIQFAQGTSDPGQVTIRTGSFMWLRRVS